MSANGGIAARPRVRAFDGLRGLAVLAVLLFHAQLSGARGGFLGVSAFFTLSGFLITSLLLQEHARDRAISLRAFWSRRARRLLPAAYIALAGVLVFGVTIATVDQARSLRGDVLATLAHVANWHFYLSGRTYAHLFSAPSPVLHFWSLAIEEQFYLLFPLVMLGVLRIARGRRVAVGFVLAVGAAASVVAGNVLLASAGESRVYYGTDTRAAELLVGALLAVILTNRPTRTTARPATTLLGVAALATMLWWWATVAQTDRWLYHGGFALHACLTAIVIACALRDGPLGRGLSWRPLVALGGISYGVYLFHWPIYLWLTPERTGLSTIPLLGLRLALTLALAIASYVYVEQPILRGAPSWRGRSPRALVPLVATALVAVLLVATWSPPRPQIVLSALGRTQSAVHVKMLPLASPLVRRAAPPTALSSRPAPKPQPLHRAVVGARPLRIMVVGDSVGLTLGRGFELYAREHGNVQVENVARMYCPLGRTLPIQQGFEQHSDLHGCDWSNWWPRHIASFDPDVVVVLFTIWEEVPRELASKWRLPGDAELDQWQLGEYEAAADALTKRGAAAVWLAPACAPNFTLKAGSPLWQLDRQLIPRLVAHRHAVHEIDLGSQLCPAGAPLIDYRGVHNARPDGAHFSDAGALALADWAMPIVLGQAPVPRAS